MSGSESLAIRRSPDPPRSRPRAPRRSRGSSISAGSPSQRRQGVVAIRRCATNRGLPITRPPIATQRLALAPDGRVVYGPKRHWRDGTSAVSFDPLTVIERLAALVPPPRPLVSPTTACPRRPPLGAIWSCPSVRRPPPSALPARDPRRPSRPARIQSVRTTAPRQRSTSRSTPTSSSGSRPLGVPIARRSELLFHMLRVLAAKAAVLLLGELVARFGALVGRVPAAARRRAARASEEAEPFLGLQFLGSLFTPLGSRPASRSTT